MSLESGIPYQVRRELVQRGHRLQTNVGSFGDPSWVPDDHEHGHGTPVERRDAYEAGVAGGVTACLPPVFDPR